MKKNIKNKNKGILFWITGLSGSGKSLIAKTIKPQIIKKYGPSILVSGDNMRKIFNFNKYTRGARLTNTINFSKFSEFITNQKINVIFNNIGMFHKARNRNKFKIENYVEIYIKADLKAWKTQSRTIGKVHDGFYDEVEKIWDKIIAIINKLLKS